MSPRALASLLAALAALVTLGRTAALTSQAPALFGRYSPSLLIVLAALAGLTLALGAAAWALRDDPSPRTGSPRGVTLALAAFLLVTLGALGRSNRSAAVVDALQALVVALALAAWLGLVAPRLLERFTPARRALVRALAVLLGAGFGLGLLELALRPLALPAPRGSPGLRYAPHPYLVYTPVPERFEAPLARFWAGADAPSKPAGTYRIVCFGGSTTEEGWPAELERALAAERPGIEVLNAGVASYTSAENLAALVFRGSDAEADVVVLEHGVNDVRPRAAPGYRRDFSHYRHPWRLTLAERARAGIERLARVSHLARFVALRVAPFQSLENVTTHASSLGADRAGAALPAGTERGFERNTRAFVRLARAYGAAVVLVTEPFNDTQAWHAVAPRYVRDGIPEHNRLLVRIASEEGALLADAAAALAGREELFVDIVHTTPAGQQRKAESVARVIREALLRH